MLLLGIGGVDNIKMLVYRVLDQLQDLIRGILKIIVNDYSKISCRIVEARHDS